MKGRLLVVLDPNVPDFDAALAQLLEPHRLDEDAEPLPRYYFDYWLFTTEAFGEPVPDVSAANIGGKCARNARVIGTLHEAYFPSVVITPDGRWNDSSEHGWRLNCDPCESNTIALRKWKQWFADLCGRHSNMIGVEVLYHC